VLTDSVSSLRDIESLILLLYFSRHIWEGTWETELGARNKIPIWDPREGQGIHWDWKGYGMELEGEYQPHHHHIISWRDRKVLFGSILKLRKFGPRDVCALLRGMEWEFEE
jgi:hypothetical protein